MKAWAVVVAAIIAAVAPSAAARESARYTGTVIDVHLHAATADANGPPPTSTCVGSAADLRYDPQTPWAEAFLARMKQPACAKPIKGSATDEELLDQTISEMRKHDVTGFLGSDAASYAKWSARAPGLFRAAREFQLGSDKVSPEQLAARFKAGEFAMLGEVSNQYVGSMASDPDFAPYLKMAADNDIPVGIHIGPGPPGTSLLIRNYRLQSPLTLQQALTIHPKLRVFVMHAGYPYSDDMKAMLYMFPGLYVDTGVLQMALTRTEYHRYLRELVEAGFGDRIMFGSDQMNWPGMIGEGIAAINDAPFLTLAQKKAILHDNAVRFFRLEQR